MANALQSVIFVVIWRGLADRWRGNTEKQAEPADAKQKAAGDHLEDAD